LRGGGFVLIEFDFPIRESDRPQVVVCRVRDQHKLLAAGLEAVRHVPGGVAESRVRGDAGDHTAAIAEERHVLGKGTNLLVEAFIAKLGSPCMCVSTTIVTSDGWMPAATSGAVTPAALRPVSNSTTSSPARTTVGVKKNWAMSLGRKFAALTASNSSADT